MPRPPEQDIRALTELTAANELDVMRHHAGLAARHGASAIKKFWVCHAGSHWGLWLRLQNQVMREANPYLRGELVVVIDCAELGRSAEFWTGVLGYVRDGVAAGRYQSLLPADGRGAEILLQRVPEDKRGKNRVHLDLRTRDLEAERHRLAGLGARVLTEEPVSEAGWRWYILADPDGNEFCVLQPPASYWPD